MTRPDAHARPFRGLRLRGSVVIFATLGLVAAGCSGTDDSPRGATVDCIDDFDAGTDYFPDKVQVSDADNFSVDYHNSYAVLTVAEPYSGNSPESYVLVRCGAPDPELGDPALADAPQISVPVTSMYAGSTTQLPAISELDAIDQLTGVADGSLVSDPQVREAIDRGDVAEYARGGTVDLEAVLAAQPEVLLSDGFENPDDGRLQQAGVNVIAGADWLESTPLGRAEWVKVIALLTGHESGAAEFFDGIKARYSQTANLVRDARPRQALLGTMYQGQWSIPTGDSHFGTLLKDATIEWPWLDSPGSGSLQMSFENVYDAAGSAPLWLAVDNTWQSTADVLAADQRYGTLAAMRGNGQVWNANLAMGPDGGNDYLERGAMRPDLVLADLVAIAHPAMLPDHDFTFYRELTRG